MLELYNSCLTNGYLEMLSCNGDITDNSVAVFPSLDIKTLTVCHRTDFAQVNLNTQLLIFLGV